MFNIVESGRLGHAEDPSNNRRYLVTFTKHDENWPGTDSPVTFAVVREENGQVNQAVGFHDEQECWDYLSGLGPKEYQSFSRSGGATSEVRERLGIPDGMIKRYQTDVETGFTAGPSRQEQERQNFFSTGQLGQVKDVTHNWDSGYTLDDNDDYDEYLAWKANKPQPGQPETDAVTARDAEREAARNSGFSITDQEKTAREQSQKDGRSTPPTIGNANVVSTPKPDSDPTGGKSNDDAKTSNKK